MSAETQQSGDRPATAPDDGQDDVVRRGIWETAEHAVLAAAILIMSLLVMGNVVSRNVFGRSWAFTEELGSLLLVVITFGGLSYAVHHGRHISMSVLHDLLPSPRQRLLSRVIAVLSALVMLVMAYISLRYVVQIAQSGDASNVLGIPMAIPLSVIPLGFLLAGVRYLLTLPVARPRASARGDGSTRPPQESVGE